MKPNTDDTEVKKLARNLKKSEDSIGFVYFRKFTKEF